MGPVRLKGEMAVSAAVSTILMVVLVIGIAMIIWSVWIGSPSILHDKVYIAGEAKAIAVNQPGGIPMQVVGFTIREAEPFHFAGQKPPTAGKEVLLKVITPDGRTLYPTPFISGGPLRDGPSSSIPIPPAIRSTATISSQIPSRWENSSRLSSGHGPCS